MNKRADKAIQEWDIESYDGRVFYCCGMKPDGGGPFPAVVFIHGGYGDNQEYTRRLLDWSVAELLLREGFAVFSADYRVDQSGRDIDDVEAAFRFVGDLPFVNERRIAYFGDSHGAYLAIMAAIRTRPYALVHGWGVADMAEWYRYILKLSAPYYKKVVEDFTKSLGGTPDQSAEAYRQVSPVEHVAKIECPVLILHGEDDEDVPVVHARILADAMKKAGGKYQVELFQNAGHGLRSPQLREIMDPLVLAFLKRYL